MSIEEAALVISEVTKKTKQKAVLRLTTTSDTYIGQTVHVDHITGYETFSGTFTDMGDGTGYVAIEVPYTGAYNCYVESNKSVIANVETLGQILNVEVNDVLPIFGFYQNFADLNPATTISYIIPSELKLFDIMNESYEPMMTNIFELASGENEITLGSWLNFLDNKLKNHMWRVDVASARGLSKVKNDHLGYTECEDGTDLTTYTCAIAPWMETVYEKEVYSSDGNRRACYFVIGDDIEKLSYSEKQGFYPKGFVTPSDVLLKGLFLPGTYLTANSDIINCGATRTVLKSQTTDQQNAIISNLSTHGVFLGGPLMNTLRDLEYMLFKSTDIQKAATYGNCNGGSESALLPCRIDTGYVRYAEESFKNGFGTAKSGGLGDSKKNLGFMFHSQVLGTYNQLLRDPYTVNDASGDLYMNHRYEYNTGTGGNKVNLGVQNQNSSWQYPGKLKLPSVSHPEYYGSVFVNENSGSTTTGLCDGNVGGKSTLAFRVGACGGDLGDGPAALRLSYAASVAGWDFGAAVNLLPDEGYEP